MMLMLMVALQAANATVDRGPFDLRTVGNANAAPKLTLVARCGDTQPNGDILVCGQRPDRFRLPLPNERDTATTSGHLRGEAQSASTVLVSPRPCGISAGDRECSKAEAARYGYGGGRDPATLLVKLGTKLLDPDADLGPSAKTP